MPLSMPRLQKSEVTIFPSTPAHIRELGDKLRVADRRELEVYGFPTNKALWKSFKGSFLRKSAFINGELAAMWGVGGSPMGAVGQPWLMTTDAVYKISPLLFARTYQREVLQMLKIFPVLVNWVDAEYNQAVRLLDIIGFNLGEPEPFGPNRAMFRKFEMGKEYAR